MRKFFITVSMVFTTLLLQAQPMQFNYQAVMRNNKGEVLKNQDVAIQINIREASATGTIVATETHSTKTDVNGLVNLAIGSKGANLASINWSAASFFVEVLVDPAGGTNFVSMGTQQMLSVPYAMYAQKAGNGFSGNYSDLSNKPTLATVATSGDFNDLSNKPASVSGDYNDLTNKPNLATVATSGSYSDLSNKPSLFSGNYSDLSGKPTLATVATSGSYSDLSNKPALATVATSGKYTDLSDKPDLSVYLTSESDPDFDASVAKNIKAADTTKWSAKSNFSGNYADLSGKPTLATVATSGSYSDLSNKPDLSSYLTAEVDGSTSNELISSATLIQDTLMITDAGGVKKVDLSKYNLPKGTMLESDTLPNVEMENAGMTLVGMKTYEYQTLKVSAPAWSSTSLTNAPTARQIHTAIWSGKFMIVFGGNGADNIAKLYEPITNVWIDASSLNAPITRNSHVAFYFNENMIVWGGHDGLNSLNNGGVYDLKNDTWNTITTSGAPEARHQFAGIWTGTEMIVWGGFSSITSGIINTGGIYNPINDSWRSTSMIGVPSARSYNSSIWTGKEMIVWGGNGSSGRLADGARYNPQTNTWTSMSSLNAPSARLFHSCVWTGTEMIIWGGNGNSGRLADGAKYNPETDTWTSLSTLNAPTARMYQSTVWTGNEMIVWGGSSNSGNLYDGAKYNPLTDTWQTIVSTNAPSARIYHSAVWTGNDMIIWGGNTGSVTNTGSKYNDGFVSGSKEEKKTYLYIAK